MWVLVFTLIMVAAEGIFLIHFVTRFTEEIFAILIACVFLTDAFKKIIKVSFSCIWRAEVSLSCWLRLDLLQYFVHDPVKNLNGYCNNTSAFFHDTSVTSNYSYGSTTAPAVEQTMVKGACDIYRKGLNQTVDDLYANHSFAREQPNVALLSMFLLIGTCTIALALKKLRRSKFFGSYVS